MEGSIPCLWGEQPRVGLMKGKRFGKEVLEVGSFFRDWKEGRGGNGGLVVGDMCL